MKAKHYCGVSKSSKYTEGTPIPGCLQYKERLALHAELAALKGHKAAFDEKKIEIVNKLGLKTKSNPPDGLKLQLHHGDIVIMHGEALQKYYEVKPPFEP
jgi:hypothetical protein